MGAYVYYERGKLKRNITLEGESIEKLIEAINKQNELKEREIQLKEVETYLKLQIFRHEQNIREWDPIALVNLLNDIICHSKDNVIEKAIEYLYDEKEW